MLTGSPRDPQKLIIRFDSHVIIVNNGTGDTPTTSHSAAASLAERNCSMSASLQTKFDIKGCFIQRKYKALDCIVARLHSSLKGQSNERGCSDTTLIFGISALCGFTLIMLLKPLGARWKSPGCRFGSGCQAHSAGRASSDGFTLAGDISPHERQCCSLLLIHCAEKSFQKCDLELLVLPSCTAICPG